MEKMEGTFRAAFSFSYFRRGSRPASTTKEPLKKRGRPRLIFHSADAVRVFALGFPERTHPESKVLRIDY